MTQGLARLTTVAFLVAACSSSDLPSSIQDEVAEAPPAQQQAFEDDTVDRAEYTRAVERAVSCMRDRGLVVSEPEAYWKNPDILQYGWGLGDSGMSESLGMSAHDGCYEDHLGTIDRAWQAQHPPPPELLEEETRLIADCFRRRGLPISAEPTREEVERVNAQNLVSANGCAAEAAVLMLEGRDEPGSP